MANYSNRTGFAWNNIYSLFSFLANELKKYHVSVFISYSRVEKPFGKFEKDFEGVFQLAPCSLKFGEISRTVLLIKREKIDSIYLTDQKPSSFVYFIYRLAGVKTIINHCRVSVPSPLPAKPEHGLRRIIKKTLRGMPFVNCDSIYAVSGFVKDRLVFKAQVPCDRVKVIRNGIDVDVFSSNNNALGNRRDCLKIFSGGRASIYKGFQYLFEAIYVLTNDMKVENIVVEYAGDGPDLEFLKGVVFKLGIGKYIRFLGEMPSTARAQMDADIIVVPSCWGDACPSSIAEALACGKPLVATSVGGIPEMIGDEANAILVPHADPIAIANALQTLINNPSLRSALGARARARAVAALEVHRYHNEVLSWLLADLGLKEKTVKYG